MPIDILCQSCGKQYQVPEPMAGRRVRCKVCQAAIAVPHLEPDHDASLDDLASLAGGTVPGPRARPSSRGSSLRYRADDALAGLAPDATKTKTGGLPTWLKRSLGELRRLRPKSLWAWAGAVVAVLLLISLTHILVGGIVAVVLGGLGILCLAAALVWGVVVGVAIGSRVIIGIIVAAPLLVVVALVRSMNRTSRNDNVDFSDVSLTQLATGVGIAFGMIALIIGVLKDPAAFRRPFHLGSVGVVLLGLCWLPIYYHGSRARDDAPQRRAPYADRSAPRRVGPPAGMPPPPVRRTAPSRGEPRVERPAAAPVAPRQVESADVSSAETLQVKWGGAWWDARVLRREHDWTLVEYASDQTREWVEPWRMRPTGSTTDDIPAARPNPRVTDPDAPAPSTPPGPKPQK